MFALILAVILGVLVMEAISAMGADAPSPGIDTGDTGSPAPAPVDGGGGLSGLTWDDTASQGFSGLTWDAPGLVGDLEGALLGQGSNNTDTGGTTPMHDSWPAVPDFKPSAWSGDPWQTYAMAGHVAQQYGVDPALLQALVKQESGGNPNAVSPTAAYGSTQFEPDTIKAFGYTMADFQNSVYTQLQGGAQYLKNALATNGGSYDLALASYNAGQGAVDKYGGIPPFNETQDYVASIKAIYQRDFGGKAWK